LGQKASIFSSCPAASSRLHSSGLGQAMQRSTAQASACSFWFASLRVSRRRRISHS